MTLRIEAITPVIGARVHGNASDLLAPGAAQKIMAALNRYDVLLFPELHLSDPDFLDLTAALGEMHDSKHTNDGSAAAQKGIFRIALDKDDKTQREFILGNDFWHIDGMSYQVPVKATLLKCEQAPKAGGDTGFASLHAAYDALPEAKKQALSELRVGHCLSASLSRLYDHPTDEDYARWDAVFPRLEHPLIWKQKSGRTTMLIGSTANDITGMGRDEGRRLLDELVTWATQDRFTYRHKWKDGDLVIFNNPCLLHRSYPYDLDAGRTMHRTTIKGSEAIAGGKEAAALGY